MTAEEKQLLTKVLLAMTPYGLIVKTEEEIEKPYVARLLGVDVYEESGTLGLYKGNDLIVRLDSDISDIKPYLRPIESMTEDEKLHIVDIDFKVDGHKQCHMAYFDFLDSIHIDYRGLIPMGLALPAEDWMYEPYKLPPLDSGWWEVYNNIKVKL